MNQYGTCRFLTAKQISEILAIAVPTVYHLAAKGQMPAPVRIGGSVRWDIKTFEEWVAAGCSSEPVRKGKK